jgi:hypothetical protein
MYLLLTANVRPSRHGPKVLKEPAFESLFGREIGEGFPEVLRARVPPAALIVKLL